MKLYTGTSGFSYKEWKGSFYPEKTKPNEMLPFYARQLPAVEINNTFYRMPKQSVLAQWREQVGDGFRFSIKASRRITHIKRLKDVHEEMDFLCRNVETMLENLGCLLFQLPGNLRKDVDRLKHLLDMIPLGLRAAFEFRHASWMDDEVESLLREHQAALCLVDDDDQEPPELIKTSDWGYLRLRRDEYSPEALQQWVERIHRSGWEQAFVFFKHEEQGPDLATDALRRHASLMN